MAKRETKWHETNRLNPFRPNKGQISSDKKHVWDGKKWVKNIGPPKKVKVSAAEFFGTNEYGSGGSKETKRSKLQGKSKDNNTDNKSKTTPKKGPVVKSVGTIDFNINTPAGLTSYNKALKASKGKKTDKERDKASNVALKEERNRKKLSANKKKRMHPIEKRNREIHGGTEVQKLKDRHAAWKKARKEGTLADWEKTYHPDREPQYRNRKKTSSESNKGSSESNKGSTNRTKLQGKSAYDTKLDLKLTDSKVYGNKKKKKNLTTNEIKYPTRGTFRGS